MNETVLALGAVSGLVLGSVEVLGGALKKFGAGRLADKNVLATILGPLSAVVVHGSGQVNMGDGAWGYVSAALLGLYSTAGAIAAHKTQATARAAVSRARGS